MTEVRLHRLALREYHRARRWYRKRSPQAAERFTNAIALALQKIERDPQLAPADDDNMRWMTTVRYPYVLHYEYFPDDVALVLAVAHEKRRPKYWLKRRSNP